MTKKIKSMETKEDQAELYPYACKYDSISYC